jgi:hypothetical protein
VKIKRTDAEEARIAEFGRSLGFNPNPNNHSWSGRKSKIGLLFAKGTEDIRRMIGRGPGKVSLDNAYYYARDKSAAELERATIADIKGYGSRVRAHKAPPAPKPTIVRPRVDFTKLDIGDARIHGVPVLLQPAHTQQLQEAGIRVRGVAGRVQSIAELDAMSFAVDLDGLLAYEPVPGKKNGEERDFAKETKKSLATVEQYIEIAINRLVELRAAIANRAKETGISQMLVEEGAP